MHKNSKIYIAGHRGMVGSAIVRKLRAEGFVNLIPSSSEKFDLTNQQNVTDFFQKEKPEYVFLAAARVGGILANQNYPADFLYDNLMIQNNVIKQSYQSGVKKLLFLGSACIYPKFAPQPIKEEYLLTGTLEPTNAAYSLAKIAGLKLCETYRKQYGCNFISVMPTNLYGPGDNYDLEDSHVLPALLRKFYEAIRDKKKEVVIWGTGKPRREFVHVDDLAEACYFLMQNYDGEYSLNIGSGEEISILKLAKIIKKITGFEGDIIHDRSKPDGTPRRLLDTSRIRDLGWVAKISLQEGIKQVYKEKFLGDDQLK